MCWAIYKDFKGFEVEEKEKEFGWKWKEQNLGCWSEEYVGSREGRCMGNSILSN